jgi:hypothetical protein
MLNWKAAPIGLPPGTILLIALLATWAVAITK